MIKPVLIILIFSLLSCENKSSIPVTIKNNWNTDIDSIILGSDVGTLNLKKLKVNEQIDTSFSITGHSSRGVVLMLGLFTKDSVFEYGAAYGGNSGDLPNELAITIDSTTMSQIKLRHRRNR